MGECKTTTLVRELLCLECGYDLRGREVDNDDEVIICPECGSSTTRGHILEDARPVSAPLILLPAFVLGGILLLAAVGLYPILLLVPFVILGSVPYLIWCGYRAVSKSDLRRRPFDPLFQAVAYGLANLLIAFLFGGAMYTIGTWLYN